MRRSFSQIKIKVVTVIWILLYLRLTDNLKKLKIWETASASMKIMTSFLIHYHSLIQLIDQRQEHQESIHKIQKIIWRYCHGNSNCKYLSSNNKCKRRGRRCNPLKEIIIAFQKRAEQNHCILKIIFTQMQNPSLMY